MRLSKAFTMLELVFVIVILGILASIAIPKLSATRHDAQVTNLKAAIKQTTASVPAHYTAQRIASFKGAMMIETSDVAGDLNVFVLTNNECTATYVDDTASGDNIVMEIQEDNATAASCLEGVKSTDDNLSLLITYTFTGDGVVSQVAELNNKQNGDTERFALGGEAVDRN